MIILILILLAQLLLWNFHLYQKALAVFKRKDAGQEEGEKTFQKRSSARALKRRKSLSVEPAASAGVRNQSDEGFDIEFSNINKTLRDGRVILNNVNSAFKSGKMTAVLGPSGAGKTTLVTAIIDGNFDEGGKLMVNGTAEDSLSRYKKIGGFVPQEDVMLRDLSVRQNIQFQADYRLPKSMSRADKSGRVDKVIEDLGLEHVQTQIIGDELTRGISGGQRKRVNIAMEMVNDPSILILDEPTSGLDSTSSLALCDALKVLTDRERITTIAVIHQPSPEAFECFDEVIILARGGKTIYSGQRGALRGYFESIGYDSDKDKNIADFALEVASGFAVRSKEPQLTPDDLFHLWQAPSGAGGEGDASNLQDVELGESGEGESLEVEDEAKVGSCPTCTRKSFQTIGEVSNWLSNIWFNFCTYCYRCYCLLGREFQIYNCCAASDFRVTPGFWRQWWICLKRGLQWYTSPKRICVDIAIHLLMGLLVTSTVADFGFVGAYQTSFCITQPVALFNNCVSAQNFAPYIIGAQFSCWAVSFAAMSSAANTFGNETANYIREYRRGMSTTAYYLGKFCAELPRIVLLCSFFFSAMIMNFANVNTTGHVFVVILGVYFWSWPLGYIIEGLVGVRLAPLYSVVVGLLLVVEFSGIGTPPLPSHPSSIRWIYDLFGIRWASEALIGGQIEHYDYTQDGEVWMLSATTLNEYGYYTPTSKCNWYQFAIALCTLAIGLFFRIISRASKKVDV